MLLAEIIFGSKIYVLEDTPEPPRKKLKSEQKSQRKEIPMDLDLTLTPPPKNTPGNQNIIL